MSFLSPLIYGYRYIQSVGATLAQRSYLNFTGSGVTVVDNPATGATDVTISGGGGGSTPTGTGLPHIVGGVQDAAASLVVNADVDAAAAIAASKVVQATGTGIPHVVAGVLSAASSLIVNADVDAAAALAGTKVAPDFGAQNVTTTGAALLGATPRSTIGAIRLPNNAGTLVAQRNSTDTADLSIIATTGVSALSFGVGNGMDVSVNGYTANLVAISSAAKIYGGNVLHATADGTNWSISKPQIGASVAWGSVDQEFVKAMSGSTYSLTATEYCAKHIKVTGTGTSGLTLINTDLKAAAKDLVFMNGATAEAIKVK